MLRTITGIAKLGRVPQAVSAAPGLAAQVAAVVAQAAPVAGIGRYDVMDAAEACAANGFPDLLRAVLSVPTAGDFDCHFRQALRGAARHGHAECVAEVIRLWPSVRWWDLHVARGFAEQAGHAGLARRPMVSCHLAP